MVSTPENLLVLGTHASHTVPAALEAYIRPEFDERLRKNFSDWATAALIDDIPEGQRILAPHGRLAGDPNRAEDAKDLFRSVDFNEVPLFTGEVPSGLKQLLLDESYRPYHAAIRRFLAGQHGHAQDTIVAFDIHDTGNWLLGEKRDGDRKRPDVKGWTMPPVMISDREGATTAATPGLMTDLRSAFVIHFGLHPDEVEVNTHYKGGHVTRFYGNHKNPVLAGAPQERSVVQVELARNLYMDERTQALNPSAVLECRSALGKVMREVADGYTHHARG